MSSQLDLGSWRSHPLFYGLTVLLFIGWPLVAFIAFTGKLGTITYDDANTLYANVFTYSQLMPGALHLIAIALTATMYIHYGVSRFINKHSDPKCWEHTAILTLVHPLVMGGLLMLCYQEPWGTFAFFFVAMIAAVISYVGSHGMITADTLATALGSNKLTQRQASKVGRQYNVVKGLFYTLPVKFLIIFLYYESMQAFMGAATTADADLGWNRYHWYVIIQVVFNVCLNGFYFTWLNCDATIGYINVIFLIKLAVVQRVAIVAAPYLWVVTLSLVVFQFITSTIAFSYVLNIMKPAELTFSVSNGNTGYMPINPSKNI